MPSYLGIILGLASLGSGIYLIAGTKESDPYMKSKKGAGIFLIILGTILFMIGALYEETYDPTSPAFLTPVANDTEVPNVPQAAVNINISGNGTAAGNQAPQPVAQPVAQPVVQPNGNVAVGITNANNAAKAARAANNAARAAANANAAAQAAAQPAVANAVEPAPGAPAPRGKFLGIF